MKAPGAFGRRRETPMHGLCSGARLRCRRNLLRAIAQAGSNEGGAVVEMAIMLPVFMMIMTGIFSFGIAFSNQLTLTQAVGAGGQYLQQISATTTDPCQDTFNAIKGAAQSLDPTKITVTVTLNGNTPSQTGNTCPGAQSYIQTAGVPVTVLATYPCKISVYGFSVSPNCQLTANVTEYEY